MPDTTTAPAKAVLKVQAMRDQNATICFARVLVLHVGSKEASIGFHALINDSNGAMLPEVMEKVKLVDALVTSTLLHLTSCSREKNSFKTMNNNEDLDDFDLVNYAFSKFLVLSIGSPVEVGTILQLVQFNPRFARHVQTRGDDVKLESLDDDDEGADDTSSETDSHVNDSLYPTSSSQQPPPIEGGAVDSVGYLTRVTFDNDDPTRPPYELESLDSSFFGLLYELIGLEGLQALWKGVSTEWVRDILNVLIQPTIEGALNDYFDIVDEGIPLMHSDNPWPSLATTIGSHVFTGWMLSPFELVKTRLVVQTTNPFHRKYKGFLHCISTVSNEEGLSAFYGGPSLLPTLLYYTLEPIFADAHHFIIYRVIGISMESSPLLYALADLGLTTLNLGITLPLETVRRRLFAQQSRIKRRTSSTREFVTCVRRSSIPYTSMWNVLYRIVTEEGTVVPQKTRKNGSRSSNSKQRNGGPSTGEEQSRLDLHISALYRGFWLRFALASATNQWCDFSLNDNYNISSVQMPTAGSFRKTVFDPILVVAQIVSLQTAYYLSLSFIVFVLETLTGSTATLDHVLNYREIRTDTVLGWALFLANLGNAALAALFMLFIVQRSRQCLDFACTLYFYHFMGVWIYSGGFPTFFFWWVAFIGSMVGCAIGGEQLCQQAELQPITFGVGSTSNGSGGGASSSNSASNGRASPSGRYKKRTSNIPADSVELAPLTSDRDH
ncbi:hypothetical protein SmJEL517_g05146 [Synchytrium microbalum]|uniref:Uncharacterized protein n=1 Tax=Synchytrium microbalum TaxID=1806994 RepID=A0A507C225_9FUNG|nr:uncharacterized protein SmJEL517_g05146 [Synchytrium microbalum]TPX31553.1 hypothetical protein SmJEL517_g05146 [Synchytrium microbalum]